MTSLKIDLYADVVCPWCLIGQHRLDNVLAQHFPDLAVDIEHLPVILIPDCPPEGLKTADLIRARGIDAAAMQARTEGEARAAGVALELKDQPYLYPTLRAHTLLRLARPLGTQHALAFALAAANFEGRNIADAEILAGIAADHGFDRADAARAVQSAAELETTREQSAVSAARGIRGVPHFVFGGGAALNGHRSEADFVAAIRQAAG